MDHAKAELKRADVKKWAAIKEAKKADDKAAKYAAQAKGKQKEAAKARELADKYAARAKRKQEEAAKARESADKYAAHAKKKDSEAQAERDAFDAISKRFKELMQPTGEPAGRPGRPKNKKPK